MRSRYNYWSNSRFADKIRGTPKPYAESSEGWNAWRKKAEMAHKIRYWIAETLLDKLQDILMYPSDKLYEVKYYLVNRFVTKTHSLTGTLKKGQYHELDERIINCLFTELVNFVEIEKSWKMLISEKENKEKYKAGFFSSGWFRLRTWRCPEAGLDYLDWESNLIMDESWCLEKDDPSYGLPPQQALNAIEIKKLYNWWKFERPNRPDPYESSGWTAYCDSKRKGGDLWWDPNKESEEEERESTRMMKELCRIEQEYFDEDTEMMKRLIEIRLSLWT